MPEWLIERGIGETRAVLVEDGEIVEARIELDGVVPAGSILQARLADVGLNGRNAIAVDERGAEYLLPRGAPGTTEGAKLRDAIAATKDFPGVTGVISINADRNAVKPAVVLKLQDLKFIYQETIQPSDQH